MKKIYIPLLALVLLASCNSEKKKEIVKETAIAVKVSGITENNSSLFVTASGKIEAENSANLSTRMMGYVTKVHVQVGQKVGAGQLLVSINNTDLQAKKAQVDASILQATAGFNNAKKDYDRFMNLFKQQSASQKELDDMTARYEMAKAGLEGARQMRNEVLAQFSYSNIKAPFSGVIVEKNINTNEWLNQGSQIATIVNTQEIEIIFNLPITFIGGLKSGDLYDIDISNQIIKAKLYAAIPSGDKLTRTFPVRFKADIKDMFIFDGASAKINFTKESKNEALVINRDAVIKRFNMDVVFAVVKDKAVMIPVKVKTFVGMNAAIEGQGLVEGMSIVTKGNERVFPDMDVKVLNNSESK